MANSREETQQDRTRLLRDPEVGEPTTLNDTAESVQADQEFDPGEDLFAAPPEPLAPSVGATLTDEGVQVSIFIPMAFVSVNVAPPAAPDGDPS